MLTAALTSLPKRCLCVDVAVDLVVLFFDLVDAGFFQSRVHLGQNLVEFLVIRGAEAVRKSYPSFWEEYKRLGGSFDVL